MEEKDEKLVWRVLIELQDRVSTLRKKVIMLEGRYDAKDQSEWVDSKEACTILGWNATKASTERMRGLDPHLTLGSKNPKLYLRSELLELKRRVENGEVYFEADPKSRNRKVLRYAKSS
jgi:hypothetical protein